MYVGKLSVALLPGKKSSVSLNLAKKTSILVDMFD